jgi:hypothetical protein
MFFKALPHFEAAPPISKLFSRLRVAEGAPQDPVQTANYIMLCEINILLMPSEDRFCLLLSLKTSPRSMRLQESLDHESPRPIQSLATLSAALHKAGMALSLH